jgi:LPXTG-motif cell wall-anchored protein
VRRLLTLGAIAGLFLPAIAPWQASADPGSEDTGIGIRLVDIPTSAAENPRAHAYIIDHVKPGKVIARRIEVVNHTDRKETVSLYATAARVEGGKFVGESGRTQNELSSWTSLDDFSVTLGAGDRSFAKVTIKIPKDAVRGERYGVVWAELRPRQNPDGVTHVSRVGIRLYVSVGPGGAPRTDFDIVSMTGMRDQNNAPVVQAKVQNTGGRAIDLSGTIALADGPAGLSAGPFKIPLGNTVGIGDTQPLLVPLDPQLPDGPWRVKITVTSGLTTRKAEATLTFPPNTGAGPEVPVDGGLTWQWITAAVIAGILVLALLGYLLARRRRREAVSSRRLSV